MQLLKRPGGELASRPLHFIWITDCSGSMSGEKIQQLNFAIRESIPHMRLVADQFFRSLKYEQLHYEKLRTLEEAKLSVIDYLAFYNGKRIHSTLGYKSPLAFERDFLKQSA